MTPTVPHPDPAIPERLPLKDARIRLASGELVRMPEDPKRLWMLLSTLETDRSTFVNSEQAQVPIDFTGVDLGGLVLSHVKLDDSDLSGSVLAGGTFNGAQLDRALLTDVKAVGVRFERTMCNKANFQRAQLTHAIFNQVVAVSAKFDHADLCSAQIQSNCVMRGVDMRSAKLRKVKFDPTSELHFADFTDADMEGVSLSGNFTNAKFVRTNLKRATVAPGTVFKHCDFTEADFTGMTMTTDGTVDCSGAKLRGVQGLPQTFYQGIKVNEMATFIRRATAAGHLTVSDVDDRHANMSHHIAMACNKLWVEANLAGDSYTLLDDDPKKVIDAARAIADVFVAEAPKGKRSW